MILPKSLLAKGMETRPIAILQRSRVLPNSLGCLILFPPKVAQWCAASAALAEPASRLAISASTWGSAVLSRSTSLLGSSSLQAGAVRHLSLKSRHFGVFKTAIPVFLSQSFQAVPGLLEELQSQRWKRVGTLEENSEKYPEKETQN